MNPAPATAARAPRWHTALLVTLIVLVAVMGTLLASNATAPSLTGPPSSRLSLYGSLLLVQWGLLFYVCRIGRTRNELPALIGVRWVTAGRAGGDIALALSTWSIIVVVHAAYTHLLQVSPNASVAALLPEAPLERALWVLVALSVGFCEEVVYRGYLLTELSARANSVTLGVILQAVLFGLAHADQGFAAATPLAAYGILFGALAYLRKSLLPGIICHVGVDLASGLLRAR